MLPCDFLRAFATIVNLRTILWGSGHFRLSLSLRRYDHSQLRDYNLMDELMGLTDIIVEWF